MTRRVAVLTTGGTIQQQSGRDGASTPGFNARRLAESLDIEDVDLTFTSILDKGSKDVVPADWQTMARTAHDAWARGTDGVVLLHGTDTMHYTAAALSFMLADLPGPVVLTGSMIPGGDPGSDAGPNLRDAVLVAGFADLAEVCVVFSADVERTGSVIIRGSRARKVHSVAVDAFGSINLPPLGRVADGRFELSSATSITPRGSRRAVVNTALDTDVALVKITPPLTGPRLAKVLEGTTGAVLEGTGVGHVKTEHIEVIRSYGQPTVLSTQATFGGERLGAYASDASLLELPNVIQGGPMTSETALVKLMWCLGQDGDVYRLMAENLAGELAG